MNRVVSKPSRVALFAAAMALPLSAHAVPMIGVHTIGNSLVSGSTADNREYVRDFYGYGSLPGNSSDPGDAAYNPSTFSSWRAPFQFHLADAGFEVDMLGTVSSVSDLPDTIIDTNTLLPDTFTTSDNRTYTYDPDNDAHGGWRIGGTYDLANANNAGSTLSNANGGATTGNGTFVYTPGQLPFGTFDSGPIDIVPGVDNPDDGVDVLDTGGNGLTADGANVFSRGIKDHLPEMQPSLTAADVVVLQIGVNDLKNREDVEGSGATVTDKIENGNAQQRLYDLILDIKTRVSSSTEIYVANIATINDDFKWDTTADAQEAIEAFNESFRDTYFGNDYQDVAGYTDALATASGTADPGGLLDNVFLVNVHYQIDELIGLNGGGTPDYSQAIAPDQLHWSDPAFDHVGEFLADVIAETTAVPEPSSALLLAGAGALLFRRRRSA